MNNDNEANDANDNGEELCVGLPETERQELLRQRREVQREIMLLCQERDRLLLERQRQMQLLEQRRLLQEQVKQRHLFQDDVDARMIRVARNQQQPQRQAFETHVLERQQQQQAKLVEEDADEDADAVSFPWSNQILNLSVAANNNK